MAKATNESKLNMLVDAIGEVNGYAICESVAGSREMKDYNRTKWGLRASALALVAVMGITTVLMPRKGGAAVGPEPGADGADVYADTYADTEEVPGEDSLDVLGIVSATVYDIVPENDMLNLAKEYLGEEISGATFTYYPGTLDENTPDGPVMYAGIHVDGGAAELLAKLHLSVTWESEIVEQFTSDEYDKIAEKYGLSDGSGTVTISRDGCEPLDISFEGAKGRDVKCLECGGEYKLLSHGVADDGVTYAAVYKCENEHEGDLGRVIVLIQKYGRSTDGNEFVEDVNGDSK